jgi:spore coat protein H
MSSWHESHSHAQNRRLGRRQRRGDTSLSGQVGRVTLCAPPPATHRSNGAPGVTRPTTRQNWLVTILAGRAWLLLLFLSLFLAVGLPARAAEAKTASASSKKDERSDAFFADRTVRHFQIELTEAAMDSLRRSPRQKVSGTVREGGKVFTNVAVHVKGMGSFRPLDEKPSFVLKFNSVDPKQEYCGLSKLMLNNSVQDSSYVCEALSTGLFRDAGVPAGRVTHARVSLNGRELGLCVAIEGMNKHFLRRHFKDPSGNLYDGYLMDVNRRLNQDNGEDTSQADVRRLYAACILPNPAERFQALSKVLDVERFASFAAMEMLISHWDGYTLKANNYRLYHDPVSDRFVFIPYGMDSVFRRLNIPVSPPVKSIVGRALFETPEGRRLYEQRLRACYTNVFQFAVITNRMGQLTSKLRGADVPGFNFSEVERQAAMLRTRLGHRVARVADELAGRPPVPLKFDATGVARAGDWRDEYDRGAPTLSRVTREGRNTLAINANGLRCRASWRTMVYLEPGLYRFEGMVRTEGITNGYADLRISGDTRSLRVTGQTPWTTLQHDFLLEEGGDVELVCELTAFGGEVWFDANSLRLLKR